MKQALLIIDVQNDYFDGGANPLEGADETVINAKTILERFRMNHLPVIHIQHLAARPTATFFLPGTKGAEIHTEVMPAEDEMVIVKNYPNSFYQTELLSYLRDNDIEELVVCGMMTHMCVDATVRAAKDYGFSCIVIGNACATRDLEINGDKVKAAEVQKAFLAALGYYYARVVNTDDFLASIS